MNLLFENLFARFYPPTLRRNSSHEEKSSSHEERRFLIYLIANKILSLSISLVDERVEK